MGLCEEYASMTPEELQILTTIVDNYREVLHSLKQSQEYKPLSLVELKSREMLVIWVGESEIYGIYFVPKRNCSNIKTFSLGWQGPCLGMRGSSGATSRTAGGAGARARVRARARARWGTITTTRGRNTISSTSCCNSRSLKSSFMIGNLLKLLLAGSSTAIHRLRLFMQLILVH